MANDSKPRADDLLSQLAGEDVDRMLAEAEVETSPASAPPSEKSSPADGPTITSEGLAENLDSLFQELAQEAGNAESPPLRPSKSEPVNGDTNALDDQVLAGGASAGATPAIDPNGIDSAKLKESLDALINDMEDPSSTTEPAGPTAVESKATPEIKEHAFAPEPAPAEARASSLAADTAAHDAQAKAASPASPESAPAPGAQAPEEKPATGAEDPLPVWLRPLEWINAPLDCLPDELREAIAKIALVTLINAVVVIGYVLLFRKK